MIDRWLDRPADEICSYKSRANILYSCAESDSAGTD